MYSLDKNVHLIKKFLNRIEQFNYDVKLQFLHLMMEFPILKIP